MGLWKTSQSFSLDTEANFGIEWTKPVEGVAISLSSELSLSLSLSLSVLVHPPD